MLSSCLVSSLIWLLLLRLDCRLLQALEKKEKLSIAASKIDIYSLKESLAVLLFHNPNPFSTVSQLVFLLRIVVFQFAHGRMESGLRKKRCRKAFGTRPSPALGVLFSAS